MIKVLVVEDNIILNKSIIDLLKKEGYIAFGATDFKMAKKTFLNAKPQIVLLDIMLPNGNGYDLIPYFRRYNDCMIIMLSALDDENNKQMSYEKGADDYITKPFNLYELIYKLNAMKRRILSNLRQYKLGDIIFNIDTNQLRCNNKSIIIQPSQMKFLKLLYEKHIQDTYLNKRELMEGSSQEANESPRIQTLVARLRKNLLYVGSKQIEIQTIYGNGYRIIIHKRVELNE